MKYKKGKRAQLSDHFYSTEFDCPCDDCGWTEIDPVLISQLEAMRTIKGSKLVIQSGYRCENYQQQLKLRGYETAVGISQHQLGKAADIGDGVTPGHELEDMARRAGFLAVGVGRTFIHVDTRTGKKRSWKYTK